MVADTKRIFDGFSNSVAGVDGGREPHLIATNQWADMENGVFRGGAPRTRPAFLDMAPTFDNPNMGYDVNGKFVGQDTNTPQAQNVYLNGMFQEASYYVPRPGQECIMVSINGHLFQLTMGETTYSVRDVALPYRNSKLIPISYHLQADIYFIVQDGSALPIIFDGSTARRAAAGEIFAGKMMGYGMGRIVLIGTDDQIYFGDIRDGKGNGGLDVLGFTETSFLNEGFPSALPSSMGHPTGIAFLPQQDSATGQGQCLVFGEKGAAGFNLGIPRETWKDSAFQVEVLIGIGNVGHRNLTVVNSDVWFRAADGRRSFRQARAEVDKWGQIPLSTNVKRYIDSETSWLLEYGSAIEFDNRLLMTSNPQPNVVNSFYAEERLYHNGLLSLDFDVLSTFGNASAPAWDGRWLKRDLSYLKCLQIVSGKFGGRDRAFAFCLNNSSQTQLVEITKSGITDTAGPITLHGVTRSMDFNSEFNEKSLYQGDMWITEICDPSVRVTTKYRPDQINEWRPWGGTFTLYWNGAAGAITPGMVPTVIPGYKQRRSLPKPADDADPISNRIYRRGYEFQADITMEGHACLRKFRMQAQEEIEESKAEVE